MTQERLSGERGADAGNASMNWLDPALIGNGSTPPTGGAHQDQEPPYGVSKEFRELGEALKPWGFRWPQAKPSPEGSAPGSAESLFLRAGQSSVAYLNWRHSTRHQLRTARLFLLMRQGWSTEAIQDAISEVALASWWLSGEAANWGYDPISRKASHALVAFLHTTPAKIEATWQQRLQQAQQARSAPPSPPPATQATAGPSAELHRGDRPAGAAPCRRLQETAVPRSRTLQEERTTTARTSWWSKQGMGPCGGWAPAATAERTSCNASTPD